MVFSQEVSFLVSWDGALKLKVSASNLGKVAFSIQFKWERYRKIKRGISYRDQNYFIKML